MMLKIVGITVGLSAEAVVGRLLLEGQQQCVLLPLINTPAINSGWPKRPISISTDVTFK